MGMIMRLFKWLFRIGVGVLAVTLAAVVYFSGEARSTHLNGASLAQPVDAIIVLGGGVEGDGRLAYSSRRRAEGAALMLAEGQAKALIMSGGLGRYHPTTPTGALMRDMAQKAGAPLNAMFVEPRSISTFENLRYSFEIAEARGFKRLAILSDPFHLARAHALARYFGRDDVALIAADGFDREHWFIRAAMLTREAMAWWFNLGKVIGWEALAAIGVDESAREGVIR